MAGKTLTRSTFGRISIDEIEPEPYRAILRAWCAQRGDRPCPLKEQIDPFVVPALAANLLLMEVQGKTLTYRVVGEQVVTAVRDNIKGKTLKQAFGDTPYVRMVEHQLLECAASGIPLYSVHDFQLGDTSYGGPAQSRKAWRIALPYGEDDRVSRLLCYQLFSEAVEVHFRKDPDFAKLLPETVFKIDV